MPAALALLALTAPATAQQATGLPPIDALPGLDGKFSVHEEIADAGGVLVWFLEGGGVAEGGGIE